MRLRVALVALGAVALIAAGALVEWAGWELVWRDAGRRDLDSAWAAAFVTGTGNNVLGALGVGIACAAIAGALTLAVPRWRRWARPGALTAGIVGALAFLGALGMLALTAS